MHPALRTLRTIGSAAKNLYFGHGAEWAAALAYYSLLSVFPGALLGVTVASLFVDQGWAMQQIVGGVGHLLPTVSSVVAHDVSEAIAERGQVSVLALLFLAWTGSRVFSTLTHALDQALGRAPRHEGFFLSLAREVLLLGLTGVVLLVGTFAGTTVDLAARALPVLPSAWIMVDRFDSLAKATTIALPTLVVHGQNDDVIPVELGERLSQAFPHATFLKISDGRHDNLYKNANVVVAVVGHAAGG